MADPFGAQPPLAVIPLGEGDPVTMVHGPQGGWHIEVGGRVQQADAAIGVAVAPRITVPELGDLEIVGDQQPTYTSLVPVGGPCDGTFYGVQGFVDTDQPDLSGLDFVCALDGVCCRWRSPCPTSAGSGPPPSRSP